MTALADLLFFTPPYTPLHEAYHVLRLVSQVKDPAALFRILDSQASFFTDYKSLLILLKETYGFTEEENPFKKARIAIEARSQEEKSFKGAGQEEKASIRQVQKIFKGRILHHSPPKPKDG